MPHPRVEPRLHDVDDEVGDAGSPPAPSSVIAMIDGVVDGEHRLGRELPDARPVEDDLDEERAGERVGDGQADHRQGGRERVAQGESPHDVPLAQPVGTRGEVRQRKAATGLFSIIS